jgi:hypothetical protein
VSVSCNVYVQYIYSYIQSAFHLIRNHIQSRFKYCDIIYQHGLSLRVNLVATGSDLIRPTECSPSAAGAHSSFVIYHAISYLRICATVLLSLYICLLYLKENRQCLIDYKWLYWVPLKDGKVAILLTIIIAILTF